MGFGLDDAGAGDQEQPASAHMNWTDFKGIAHKADFILRGESRVLYLSLSSIFICPAS
jgi:hypothetical protein